MANPILNPPMNLPASPVTPLPRPPSSSSPPPILTAAHGQSAAASEIQDRRPPLPPSSAASGPRRGEEEEAKLKELEWLKLVVLTTLVASETYNARVNVDPAPSSASSPRGEEEEAELKELERLKEMQGWLMVLATLVASVTYSAGINVPGGFWQDDSPANDTKRHTAGNPVLADKSQTRYIIFFYSNASAFVASIVAIVLLFRRSYFRSEMRLPFLFQYLLGSLITLVVAFCAGSTRTTSDSIGMGSMLVFVSVWLLWVLKCQKNAAN